MSFKDRLAAICTYSNCAHSCIVTLTLLLIVSLLFKFVTGQIHVLILTFFKLTIASLPSITGLTFLRVAW